MTSTIAFIGKSGSGKTTLTKSFAKLIKQKFPNSTILLVDNDLSLELSERYGIKAKNTIYGVKSGKHEYKTGIPEGMSKQEFIEWALEDIIINIDENVDIIASWLVTPKDCKCIDTKLTRDSLVKIIDWYDFVIFDCEFDLKYLNSLVDYPIDETIIVSNCDKQSFNVALKIADFSKKYAADGRISLILNKVNKENSHQLEALDCLELNLLGNIQEFNEIDYNKIANVLSNFYSRINLPQ